MARRIRRRRNSSSASSSPTRRYNLFPQANLHTQWPGTGMVGDPLFDQFQATMLPDFKDRRHREPLNRDAGDGAARQDRPGLILMPHSQAGAYAWLMADARPNLVKGCLMVEAAVVAVLRARTSIGAPDWFKEIGLEKPWGFTRTPLTSIRRLHAADLDLVQQEKADAPDLVRCWRQKEPARKLVNFKAIPVLLMVGEASFQAPTAHCNAAFLKQAGVQHDFVRLADVGIHGNGHFLMLEKNNLEVAAVIADWLNKRITPIEIKEQATTR